MGRKLSRKRSRKRTTRKPSRPSLASLAAQLGRRGGKARAKNLTAEERRAGAKKAAQARWSRKRPT